LDTHIPTFSKKRTESSQLIYWVTEKQNVWVMFIPWRQCTCSFTWVVRTILGHLMAVMSLGFRLAISHLKAWFCWIQQPDRREERKIERSRD
jgi:hypothetical protein